MSNIKIFIKKVMSIHILINIVICISLTYSVSYFGLPEEVIPRLMQLLIGIGFISHFAPSIISIRGKAANQIVKNAAVYLGSLIACVSILEIIRIIVFSSDKNISDSHGFAMLLGYYMLIVYNVGVMASVIITLIIKLIIRNKNAGDGC